ncbi:MAG: hypothetical protein QXX95_06545 [Nitrososphaerales archaeon]
MNTKIETLGSKMDVRFESLEKRLELVQQVTVLQAKVKGLEENPPPDDKKQPIMVKCYSGLILLDHF